MTGFSRLPRYDADQRLVFFEGVLIYSIARAEQIEFTISS